jgi:hypothetical protein
MPFQDGASVVLLLMHMATGAAVRRALTVESPPFYFLVVPYRLTFSIKIQKKN